MPGAGFDFNLYSGADRCERAGPATGKYFVVTTENSFEIPQAGSRKLGTAFRV